MLHIPSFLYYQIYLMLVIVSDVKHYDYKVAIFLRYLLVDKKEREINTEATYCASESIQ
jgi:hypothetical protein